MKGILIFTVLATVCSLVAGFISIDDISPEKLFYNPGDENYDLINYKGTLADIKQFEKVNSIIAIGGGIPEIGIAFKLLTGYLSFIGKLTWNKDKIFWEAIQKQSKQNIMEERLSTMRSQLTTFQDIFRTVKDGDSKANARDGLGKIQEILNFFEEPSSILRQFPLHSSPLLLEFVPIIKVYVGYVALKFNDTVDPERGNIILNQAMLNLEAYKKLCVMERMNALGVFQWKGRGDAWGGVNYWKTNADVLKIFAILSKPTITLPQIRCYNCGCSEYDYSRRGWKEGSWEGAYFEEYFISKTFKIDDGEENRCLSDMHAAFQHLYQTVFWRIGSLIF